MFYIIANDWKNYISDEFNQIINEILNLPNWKLISAESSVTLPEDSEYVLEWETYDIEVYGNCKRAFFCDDLHYKTPELYQRRLKKFEKADIILATYAPLMRKFEYPEHIINKTKWIPHCASNRFRLCNTYNIKDNPTILIPMPSNNFQAWYPNRLIISKICSNVKMLNHPGYTHYPTYTNRVFQDKYNVDPNILPLEFSKAFGVICDSSVYHYLLAKHFEIMASGALLICDEYGKNLLEKLGYIDNIHFVSYTIYNIAHVMEKLKEPSSFMNIRESGYNFTKDNHMVSNRVKSIIEIFSPQI